MNTITSQNTSLFQQYSFNQNSITVQKSDALSGKNLPASSTVYQQQITEIRLEMLFSTKEELNKQTSAAAVISISDFATTPPEQHLAMIQSLDQDQAAELISEDGFYGVAQTAERLAKFVLMGAGDDLDKLRAGREGILRGFKEAEEIWGGKLPELSYKTIDSAVKQIDEQISKLGGSILDIAA